MSIKSDNENDMNDNRSDRLDNSDVQEETKLDENAPRPRLCHLKKWPNFQGYGFNLHAERAKMGQHIGKVDADSPAESAGLREGDRIIEVNYVNISNENHQQVVRRIRNGFEDPADGLVHDDEVILLVLDAEADDYYKKRNIVVRNDFENVSRLKTGPAPAHLSEAAKKSPVIVASSSTVTQQNGTSLKDSKPASTESVVDRNNNMNDNVVKKPTDSVSNTSTNSKASAGAAGIQNHGSANRRNSSETPLDRTNSNSSKASSTNGTPPAVAPANARINQSTSSSASSASSTVSSDRNPAANNGTTISPQVKTNGKVSGTINNENSLNSDRIDPFQMSAAEFKNYLKNKGRNDPRIAPVDMKQKFKIFQDM